MSVYLYNRPLKIWESMGIPTPKVGVHLGVWGFILSHSPTLPWTWNVTLWLHSWPTPLQTLAFVTTLALGLQPRQGLTKVWAKSEPESHISCSQECKKVWKYEPPHSQVSSHFGSWSPHGLLNFQRAIVEVKIHWNEDFIISLEISWNLDV
jgi:hypothetical protein